MQNEAGISCKLHLLVGKNLEHPQFENGILSPTTVLAIFDGREKLEVVLGNVVTIPLLGLATIVVANLPQLDNNQTHPF